MRVQSILLLAILGTSSAADLRRARKLQAKSGKGGKGTPVPAPVAPPVAPPVEPPVEEIFPCEDDADFTFTLTKMKIDQGCEWITRNSAKTATRQAAYCTGDVADSCPVACGTCPPCEDNEDFTFPLDHDPSIEQDCKWICWRNADKRQPQYCSGEIANECPKSCGLCE